MVAAPHPPPLINSLEGAASIRRLACYAMSPRSREHKGTLGRGGEGWSSSVRNLINAAPCLLRKVPISTLMHLPVKVTEAARTLLTPVILMSLWNREPSF